MTKAELIKKIGRPESVSADSNKETLHYVIAAPWWQFKPFLINIVDGKVESYETK